MPWKTGNRPCHLIKLWYQIRSGFSFLITDLKPHQLQRFKIERAIPRYFLSFPAVHLGQVVQKSFTSYPWDSKSFFISWSPVSIPQIGFMKSLTIRIFLHLKSKVNSWNLWNRASLLYFSASCLFFLDKRL